jgi:UDP-glucose 4-epimerase
MTTYLVTGGAGFIGSHIATALAARGDRVRVLDNLSTGSRQNLAHLGQRIELIEGDLLDVAAVEQASAGCEAVYHQAALASVPRSVERPLDTNAACVTGTLHVLEAARKAGVRRVVYAGSSSVYGNQPKMPKVETDLPNPLSPYAAAKLAGEYYCRAFHETYGLETVVIRYFNVFGPRQDPHSEYSAVIPKFVTAMLAGRRPTVFGDGRQSRDFTFIDNVVAGNLAAESAPEASSTWRADSSSVCLSSLSRSIACSARSLSRSLPCRAPETFVKAWPISRPPDPCWATSPPLILKPVCEVRSTTTAP